MHVDLDKITKKKKNEYVLPVWFKILKFIIKHTKPNTAVFGTIIFCQSLRVSAGFRAFTASNGSKMSVCIEMIT